LCPFIATTTTATAQETVASRFGTDAVEWQIAPELWVESVDRPAAEAVLASLGLSEFEFEIWLGCSYPDSMLFVRQDASAPPTPVLTAIDLLTGPDGGNPWFWSVNAWADEIRGGGFVLSEYVARFLEGTTAERASEVVEALGLGTVAPPVLNLPPDFRILSSRRSGVDVLLDLETLFQHPEVEAVYPVLVSGCPSGGPDGGGTPPLPAEVPSLGQAGAIAMAILLALAAAVAVRRARPPG
jgi:hypothetical protein